MFQLKLLIQLNLLCLDTDKITPAEVVIRLSNAGIESRPAWKPMHMQPVFANAPFVGAEESAVSEMLFSRGICLPGDTKLTNDDIGRVAETLKSVF